jgi:hypothetical protein
MERKRNRRQSIPALRFACAALHAAYGRRSRACAGRAIRSRFWRMPNSTIFLLRVKSHCVALSWENRLAFKVLDENVETTIGHISIGTMHLAKGLEFRAVAVMACDDEVIPLQERIETVGDDADLQEVYDTERHLLYVACTRARDHLLITSVEPASEFLDDLRM